MKTRATDERERREAIADWVSSIREHVASGWRLDEAVRLASENPPALLLDPLTSMTEGMPHSSLKDSLIGLSKNLDHEIPDMAIAVLLTAENLVHEAALVELLGQLTDSLRPPADEKPRLPVKLSVDLSEEEYRLLTEIADREFVGNIRLLMRVIVTEWLESQGGEDEGERDGGGGGREG